MLKRLGDLMSILTLDLEIQSLEFVQLSFGLALIQYFLTMSFSLPFGIIMYILCHCVFWKYVICFLILTLQLRDCMNLR